MIAPRNTGRGTRNEHQTVTDPLARIADALERIAEHHTPPGEYSARTKSLMTKGPKATYAEPHLPIATIPPGVIVTRELAPHERNTEATAARLTAWLTRAPDSDQPMCDAHNVLLDAIKQATKPETIAWLAALAERYGFNNDTP